MTPNRAGTGVTVVKMLGSLDYNPISTLRLSEEMVATSGNLLNARSDWELRLN